MFHDSTKILCRVISTRGVVMIIVGMLCVAVLVHFGGRIVKSGCEMTKGSETLPENQRVFCVHGSPNRNSDKVEAESLLFVRVLESFVQREWGLFPEFRESCTKSPQSVPPFGCLFWFHLNGEFWNVRCRNAFRRKVCGSFPLLSIGQCLFYLFSISSFVSYLFGFSCDFYQM